MAWVVTRRAIEIEGRTYVAGDVLPQEFVDSLPRPESWVRAGLMKEVADAKPGGTSGGRKRGRPRKQSQPVLREGEGVAAG